MICRGEGEDLDSREFDISSRVIVRQAHEFEVKLEYNLEELQETNRYKVETYFFFPESLEINKSSYPNDRFYQDLKNHIRFKTPDYSYEQLLEPGFAKSPFHVMGELFRELQELKDTERTSKIVKKTIKELKLLACIVKARLRDLETLAHDRKKDVDEDSLLKALNATIQGGPAVLNEFRQWKIKFHNHFFEQKSLLTYFQLIDEYLSCLLEEDLVDSLCLIREKIPGTALEEQDKKLAGFLEEEKIYREKEKFSLVFRDNEKSKESYLYYLNRYKKIINSVLHLDMVREKHNRLYTHAVGSLAAFIAASVSYLLTVIITGKFALENSIVVFVGFLIYAFKDRIKDLIKLIFTPRVNAYLPDHTNRIFDGRKKKESYLGRIKETTYFTKMEDIEPTVINLRKQGRGVIYPEESPEEVMVYRKEIEINTAGIQAVYFRMFHFTDIMRFGVQKYLQKMEDPVSTIHYYDPEKRSCDRTRARRVYHVNMVLKYSKFSEKVESIKYERYRLVLDRDGIRRIEFVKEI